MQSMVSHFIWFTDYKCLCLYRRQLRGRFYLSTTEDFPFYFGNLRKRRTTVEDIQKFKEKLMSFLFVTKKI